MSAKYFTIVIRADDETAARQLTPGAKIGPNPIVGCSLGNQMALNDRLRELIPEEKDEHVMEADRENLAAFNLHAPIPGAAQG